LTVLLKNIIVLVVVFFADIALVFALVFMEIWLFSDHTIFEFKENKNYFF